MDKIYVKDNYIVAEVGGETSVFSKYYASYYETSTHFFITNIIGQSYVRTLSIDLTDIPNFYNEAGTTAYTITTLRTFLRLNTGFKSPSGGSGGVSDGNKGDITVTGSGATWTVNSLAIDDGKISDVDASKVVENSTARFVTDTDLINLSNLSGTNSGDETTGSIKTKLGAATGTTDGYLTAADWDIFNGKQPVLISGTNIKTIEGQSLLGSGNIDLTKSDVGLGNCDNTSDANKPVSTAQATAIALKQDTLVSGTNIKTIGGSSILGAGNLPIPDPAGWTIIVKSANQDVTNSATLVTDTDLQFSVVAGGHYMIEVDVVFSCNNTSSDYKNAFNVSAGTMSGKGYMIGPTATAAAQVNEYAVNAAATTSTLPLGSPIANLDSLVSTKIIFSFMASANATFRYQFSQNAAIAATTARTWKGSILKYKRID